jgi:hypothetical protein
MRQLLTDAAVALPTLRDTTVLLVYAAAGCRQRSQCRTLVGNYSLLLSSRRLKASRSGWCAVAGADCHWQHNKLICC